MRTIKYNHNILLFPIFLILLAVLTLYYQYNVSNLNDNITVQNKTTFTTIPTLNNTSDINTANVQNEEENSIDVVDTQVAQVKETFITTIDMSHYTNEVGSHVPASEGGAIDRKGNKLVPYESIAIPKKLYKHLPYGSTIKIVAPNGEVYYGKAVDTGGALNRLNRIDRCVSSYKEVQSLGVIKNVKIYKVN